MANRRYRMIAHIPDGDGEQECRITFRHTPGRPARWYLRNGDPGYPADPAEVSLHEVEPAEGDVPIRVQQAIWCWACDYLASDEGREAAFAVVDAAMEVG